MVLVEELGGPLESSDVVDRLLEAVDAQPGTLGASVAAALERVGRAGPAVVASVFAEDGRVAYKRSRSS
jgi:hypothetical protein